MGNPKRAGFDGVLRNHNGDWVHGFSGYLGANDILYAELMGIKTGLMVAWQLNYKDVILETDSLEACRLVTSIGHNFHIYGALLADIHALRARQWKVEVFHILREGNRCADAMAKHGANHEDPFRDWNLPPEDLSELLAADAAGAVFVRC